MNQGPYREAAGHAPDERYMPLWEIALLLYPWRFELAIRYYNELDFGVPLWQVHRILRMTVEEVTNELEGWKMEEHKGLLILQKLAEETGDHVDDVVHGLQNVSALTRHEILTDLGNSEAEIAEVNKYLATLPND